jgi:hypothetical protein
VSNASFVTLTSPASGTGDGSVSYTVSANPTTSARQATLALGGQAFELSEAGLAATTSLSFTSDAGDYIGGGQSHSYTLLNASVLSVTLDSAHRILGFRGQGFDGRIWDIDLAAPAGQQLLVGTYANAIRYPFQAPGQPGLAFSYNSRGCNELSGSFVILQAVYGPANTVTSFHATLEQHCEKATPALHGDFWIVANGLAMAAPTGLGHARPEPAVPGFTALTRTWGPRPSTVPPRLARRR